MILLQAIDTPNEFFTLATFTTLAGAAGIVYVICGGVQRAFNYNPKWLALLISIIVSFIALMISPLDPKIKDWVEYLIAFMNGFLIFMTATGTNQVVAPPPPTTPTSQNFQKPRTRGFNDNWWK